MHYPGKINKRQYSNKSLRTPPYTFPLASLRSNKQLTGLSGVYMIVNNDKPSSFYIGSSVNLFRRLGEYLDLTMAARKPFTSFETKLLTSNAENWTVVVLAYVPKHLVLVEEQLAICNLHPTLNRSYKVAFNYWLPGFDLNDAINRAVEYRSLFAQDSVNYSRFTHLIDSFSNAQSVKHVEGVDINDIGNLGKPVFVYDYKTTLILAVYGSINSATSAMNVSQDTIYTSVAKGLVYTRPNGQQLVISNSALTSLEVANYIEDVKPTQVEYSVSLTDAEGNIVEEYKSLRAFCKAKNLSMRTLGRQLPELSEYDGLSFNLTAKSRRLAVYCYDPDTQLRVGHFISMTAAHKTVNLHYNTFQGIVKSNGVHNGVLYSFSNTYPSAD